VRWTRNILGLFFVLGCSREPSATRRNDLQANPSTSLASSGPPTASVFPGKTPPAVESAPSTRGAVQQLLQKAPITALKIASWSHPGFLQATIERPHSAGFAHVTMNLALDQHPVAHRRSLALAHLAAALEMHVVPATVVRRLRTDELGVFFDNDPNVQAYLAAHAVIQNDGTIDTLVMAPSCGDDSQAWKEFSRRELVLDEAPEVRAWAAAVASAEALPGENKTALRDYVEVLVLDYLTGNVMRRSVLFDEATSTLQLADNDGAFPMKSAFNLARGETRLLDRLKPVLRFPRSLRDALTRFDRVQAQKVFLAGTFDEWLLSPRTLMILDERRATLLTLLHARIDAYGEQAVLSL
jgi:hypothetical protein